jgi:hypothetical protein
MAGVKDGPHTRSFSPVPFAGNATVAELARFGVSSEMVENLEHAPSGECVCWGIPFEVEQVVIIQELPVTVDLGAVMAPWLVFLHTSDQRPLEPGRDGFISPMRGSGQLAEHAADYVVLYADGSEERVAIRRRHQIGAFQR